ncbi:succinate dehydrogenase [Usitatibacter palustris]|uniref:Succinate dehydrogenase cytochrome b556 subunit n=1 Tax=Usitatibacter palustris TaxID=2732487 RepID=A0A6M4HAF9_9PROT|nr:succinate dehydrogenase [Usitatibacter palustris]QJR16620.1 hypothetical protein DSM104440_03455 [Usitatibacter palustris]
MKASRNHPAFWAFVVHRLSGIGLAAFLPAHFYVLGSALNGEAALGEWIDWTQRPLLKFAEWILVLLLAAHLTGGLRLLALEFLPWRNWQKTLAALAAGASLVVMLIVALAR